MEKKIPCKLEGMPRGTYPDFKNSVLWRCYSADVLICRVFIFLNICILEALEFLCVCGGGGGGGGGGERNEFCCILPTRHNFVVAKHFTKVL